MPYIMLNYELNGNRKYYRGRQIELEHIEKPADTHFGRESRLSFGSHSGTHIDFPAHFLKDGRYGNEYPCDYLFSSKAAVIHAEILGIKTKLEAADINLEQVPADVEILLINTGYCNIRDEDAYWAC